MDLRLGHFVSQVQFASLFLFLTLAPLLGSESSHEDQRANPNQRLMVVLPYSLVALVAGTRDPRLTSWQTMRMGLEKPEP